MSDHLAEPAAGREKGWRIVITGAAGRMGRVLRDHWQGRDLVSLDRENGDLDQYGAWAAEFAGAHAVIHLAAASTDGLGGFETAAYGNVVQTLNVLRSCREHGIRRLVLASSVWADHAAFGVSPSPTYYAASKQAGEALARAWASMEGGTAVCLRLGHFDPAWNPVPDEVEVLRLDEAALCHHLDRALAWPGPGCAIWNAFGRLGAAASRP